VNAVSRDSARATADSGESRCVAIARNGSRVSFSGTIGSRRRNLNYAEEMSSVLINITERGQISIPSEIRRKWQVRRVLLVDEGDRIVLRPVADDPIAAVAGKYSWIEATSDEMRAEDRAVEIERSV
jgi:AbrB family looped-hinge helix DNA binding protein